MASSKEQFNALREQETSQENSGITLELKSILQAEKKQLVDISKSIVQRVADGELDPFKAWIHNRKIKEIVDLNEKNLRPYINSKGIPKAGLTMYNVAFTSKSDAAKWDYSECNDPEYTQMLEDLEKLKELIEKKQTVLKNMDKAEEKVDTETGETYTVYPAIKTTGAENFAATLK